MSFCQFEGAPCLRHNNYVFYKAFKYKFDGQNKILALGDFFFLKILQEIPVCIGEIELLWEDKASNQFLASLRLYFRPEHTPDGRQDDTGEDEVVAVGERLVLKLEDLAPLIQHDVKWVYGCPTYCYGGGRSRDRNGDVSADGCGKDIRQQRKCGTKPGGEDMRNGIVVRDGHIKRRNLSSDSAKMDILPIKNVSSGAANLAVMSYPKYCRYRAIQKRLEGCENELVHLAVVVAIGGFSGRAAGCRVMFCRDTFYRPEIDDLDIRMDHMLPVLKGRTKGKKSRQLSRKDSQQDSDSMEEIFANVTPTISSSSRPRRLTESSEINEDKVSTEEQAFLIGLHKFMHDAKMPIGRIPSLGFKQIDLYYFYKQAEKLGGYDSITHKRMWKHLYDKLGGNASNTSAATCTRKHYERLLLPYERHLRKIKMGKAKKKQQKQVENESNTKAKVEGHVTNTNVKENVDVKPKIEVKEETVEEIVEPDTKNSQKDVRLTSTSIESSQKDVRLTSTSSESSQKDVRLTSTSSESSQNCQNESTNKNKVIPCVTEPSKAEPTSQKEKPVPDLVEHSKAELQESEVLEIPLVRHSISSNSGLPSVDAMNIDGNASFQHFSLPETEQQYHQQVGKSSTGLVSEGPSSAFMLGDNPALGYANVVYRGGYLVPVLPHQLLHTPWGVMVPPSSSACASSPQMRADVTAPYPGTNFKDSSNTSLPLSSKTNQDSSSQDIRNKSSARKLQLSSQTYQTASSSGNDVQKAAHTNTPYKPSPYLLNDHIQPPHKVTHSSHHLPSSNFLSKSSQNLTPMLHLTPPGHKSYSHLPPAPTAVYLNPSCTSPFSPLHSPIISTPPPAHCHPRKRAYPFDSPPAASSTGVFPSPDIVLDRIRNSTGLPRSNAVLANPLSVRQRYEDPRQIFTQTAPPVGASHNSALSQRKEPSIQQELVSSKLSNTKSKNSRKCHQAYSVYSHMSSPELQQAILQQGHLEHRPSNSTKVVDQTRPTSHLNGILSTHPTSKSVNSVVSASPVPSSSKDGRLTSALFGTQFTAVPRTTKPSELTYPQSLMADPSTAAVAAMSLSPHPAFLSPYLPAGTAAAASAMNSQFQMLASAFATPAQLAAYEEMFRQNGYGAFLTAAAQGKLSKKN